MFSRLLKDIIKSTNGMSTEGMELTPNVRVADLTQIDDTNIIARNDQNFVENQTVPNLNLGRF